MSDKDGSIFGSTPAPETQGQVASDQQEVNKAEAPSRDPYADLLSGITTEDGRPKYATVSDAINSIPHAQKHIQTLESELADLRSRYQAMESQWQQQTTNPEPQQSGIGEDQVAGLVNQVLSQREQQAKQTQNINKVVETMTAKFGSAEAADKAYRAKAEEMGINLDMMNSLAMHSPQAVLAYFGTTGASAPTKTQGTLNTAATPQVDPAKGKNPLLSGSMKDMEAEIARISKLLG